jgi:hypothetical protein
MPGSGSFFDSNNSPSANQTFILSSSLRPPAESGGVRSEAQVSRYEPSLMRATTALSFHTSVPMPVEFTEGLDNLTDILAVPPLAMNLNSLKLVA